MAVQFPIKIIKKAYNPFHKSVITRQPCGPRKNSTTSKGLTIQGEYRGSESLSGVVKLQPLGVFKPFLMNMEIY